MLIQILAIEVLLWSGMILGISFLESWVKFRAPLPTKPIGLDVGRTVFSAFHQVQWALLLLAIFIMLFIHRDYNKWILIISITLTLIFQTLWIHPKLKDRIDLILAGQSSKPSYLHSIYVGLELIKLVLLISLGVNLI
jgi:hypothetical protein